MLPMLRRVRNGYDGRPQAATAAAGVPGIARGRGSGGVGGGGGGGRGQWWRGAFVGAASVLAACAAGRSLLLLGRGRGASGEHGGGGGVQGKGVSDGRSERCPVSFLLPQS